ncbi:MAG TPA: MBL fold metallo-hydrolase [Bryobacteraceae bacterium]|nr:MBL fold metallo-hydrolase [Bryobacteraceae bacterium]
MTALRALALVGFAVVASGQQDVAFEVLHVRGNVYMFASTLGNITVQVGKDPGHDGILLVDSGPVQLRERVLAELRKLSSEPVRYILNTSADADHTGGNEAFVKPDARPFYQQPTVAVFAQDNVLTRMSAPGSGSPSAAWPSLTFDERNDLEFNGETVQMFAEKGAHTDGDSIVLFRGSNVLSAGDVFLTTGYPVIDVKRGGGIQGELKALNHILDLTVPHAMQEGGTMVIPGHGRLCDQADVTEYRDMLTIIRDRVTDLMMKHKTLDEVKAARPTRDYDRRYSTSSWTGDMLVEAIFRSLEHR